MRPQYGAIVRLMVEAAAEYARASTIERVFADRAERAGIQLPGICQAQPHTDLRQANNPLRALLSEAIEARIIDDSEARATLKRALDVLVIGDRIIDEEAQGEDQRKERHAVDRI
jgi:hypothetical protein